MTALEGGSDTPAALLKAMADREASIKRLEGELRKAGKAPPQKGVSPDLTPWVTEQLEKLTELLKADPSTEKAQFRRLNLKLVFIPNEAEPRPYYTVSGPCDLTALAFFYWRSGRQLNSAMWTDCWSIKDRKLL